MFHSTTGMSPRSLLQIEANKVCVFWFSMIWNCIALKIGYQCRNYNFDQQNFKKVPLALSWHTILLHITLLHLYTDKQTDKYAWY